MRLWNSRWTTSEIVRPEVLEDHISERVAKRRQTEAKEQEQVTPEPQRERKER